MFRVIVALTACAGRSTYDNLQDFAFVEYYFDIEV